MNRDVYFDKMMGCWLGKNIGGTIGAPVEGRRNPVPLPLAFPEKNEPNDDLDLQLVWLDMLNRRGVNITAADFAECWLNRVTYPFDEYGICVANIRRGLQPPQTGYYNNYFKDCMGSPIRSEIWGCLCPGEPASAGYYALQDAQLDHYDEGVYGEIFFACAESIAFEEDDIVKIIDRACEFLPEVSVVKQAVLLTVERYQAGVTLDALRHELILLYADANFSHCVINIAFTVAGMLYAEMDFLKSMVMAVNLGFDTDCTGATAGAIVGIVKGFKAIQAQYQLKFDERVLAGWGVKDIQVPKDINAMSEEIVKLNEQFRRCENKPSIPKGFQLPAPQPPPADKCYRARLLVNGLSDSSAEVLAEVAARKFDRFVTVDTGDDILNLEPYRNYNYAYILTEIRLPSPGRYKIAAMSACPVKLWFNGIPASEHAARDFAPSPHRCGDFKVREFTDTFVQVLVEVQCRGYFPARLALVVADEKNFRVVDAQLGWDDASARRQFDPLAVKPAK